MRRLSRLLASAVALAIALASSAASAQEQPLQQQARAAFGAGEFHTAGRLFEELNRKSPHASYLFNAALAWDQAGAHARAADAYEGALRIGGLDETREAQTSQRLAELKRRVGSVSVPRPIGGTVTVAHVSKAPLPAKFHLSPGSHSFVVERPDGTTAQQAEVVRAGELLTVSVASERPRPVSQVSPGPKPSEPNQEGGEQGATNSAHTWGWVALGGAAALTGAWAYFALDTNAQRTAYDDSGRSDLDARDRGVRSRAFAWITGSAALASGTVGILLLVSDGESSKHERAGQVDVRFSPSRVTARLRF